MAAGLAGWGGEASDTRVAHYAIGGKGMDKPLLADPMMLDDFPDVITPHGMSRTGDR